MRKLVIALPLLFSLGFSQDLVIQSDNSRRVIQHWSASGAAGLAQGPAKAQAKPAQYYWAVFTGIVGVELTKWLEDQGGENLGLAGRPGSLKVYKMRVKSNPAALYERMKDITGFVNLLPVIREEKISRGLLRADGQAIKATVFFHRDMGFPEMESMLEGKVDEIFEDQDPRLVHVLAAPERLRALADIEDVRHVQEELKKQPVNDASRGITKVDALQAGTLNVTSFPPTQEWNRSLPYTGDSIWVGVNEGFDINHWDFREALPDGRSKPRVSHGSDNISPDFHGSHVAGIIGGNGWRSELSSGARYQWRGVAPKVLMTNHGDKGDVNNHSFTNGDDALYNFSDAYVDARLSKHLSFQEDYNNVAVWSAANNGGYWPQYGFQRGYYSMLVNAKNPIKVGATTSQGYRAYFSSMGPTRDGRWGPDVMAPGESIMSVAAGGNGYTWMGGTSMSGPHITGITALIMQKYRDNILRASTPAVSVHEDPMWNSSVKAILVHTAKDMVDLTGREGDNSPDFEYAGFPNTRVVYGPGPDWATGFGIADAQRAVQHVDINLFRESSITSGQTLNWTITVPAGRPNLRATIAWDDPEWAGVPDASNAYVNKLVNDLDLRLVSPTGQVFLPWVLDHAPLHNGAIPADGLDPIIPSEILDRPAVKGRDGVNNVEVVDVANPAAGTWTIQVYAPAVNVDQSYDPGLNQNFSLVSDMALPPVPALPAGPDLIIPKVIFTPHRVTAGATVSFSAEVRNIGTAAKAAGTSMELEFRIYNSAFAVSVPVTQALLPGQSVIMSGTIGANGNTPAWRTDFGGAYAFTAVVDPNGTIAEQRERNNTHTAIVNVPNMPEPWESRDIGVPGFSPGGARIETSVEPHQAYIWAAGSDIYGNADDFHYMYRPLAGNGEMTIQTWSNNASHEWSKFGLMIREDLTPGSRNVFVAQTLSHGATFQHRSVANGATVTAEIPSDVIGWLRIVRSGNVFTGFRSSDGVAWTQVGTVTLALPTTVYIGMAATTHDVNAQATFYMTIRSLTGAISTALRGRILDQSANPVPNATLTLSGSGTGTVQTDAHGLYAFTGLAAGGSYTVTPSKSGFTFQPVSASLSNLRFDGVLDFSGTGSVVPELPQPWVHSSVGAEGLAGGASHDNGVFTVKGSGADIWGTADGFHFAHQPFTGDVQVTARVTGLTNTDPWAKAGVMIRESPAPGARHAFMALTIANGSAFQRREAAAGPSLSTGSTGAAPLWVRLVRVGNNVKGYRSADGVAWTLVGETNIAFPAQVMAGLAVTSHNNTLLGTATFESVTLVPVTAPVFTATDVGAVGIAGSSQVSNGTYTLTGAGADIWGNADSFHFYHRSMIGDGSIVARVVSMSNTHQWAKTGVMIRETTAAGSRQVYVGTTPASGMEFLRREVLSGTTVATSATGAAPYWVRLVRSGNVFTSSVSANGTTWTQVGTVTIAMAADVRVGLAVTSHNTAATLTGVLDQVTIVE